jgi:hypothetical protein
MFKTSARTLPDGAYVLCQLQGMTQAILMEASSRRRLRLRRGQ